MRSFDGVGLDGGQPDPPVGPRPLHSATGHRPRIVDAAPGAVQRKFKVQQELHLKSVGMIGYLRRPQQQGAKAVVGVSGVSYRIEPRRRSAPQATKSLAAKRAMRWLHGRSSLGMPCARMRNAVRLGLDCNNIAMRC